MWGKSSKCLYVYIDLKTQSLFWFELQQQSVFLLESLPPVVTFVYNQIYKKENITGMAFFPKI
jgi:hypothetical protein